MTSTEKQARIRDSIERSLKAMEARSTIGRGTATTRVRWTEGLRCEVEEGEWRLAADMSTRSGGEGTAPNPGIYGRAALGTCLVISYAKWAAWKGIELTSLEVDVEADYDARGEYGLGEVTAGYSQVRVVVRVTSPHPEEEVRRVLEEADRNSPYMAVFREPQEVRREIRFEPARS
jgi:uncharacterized OsmC-like protein